MFRWKVSCSGQGFRNGRGLRSSETAGKETLSSSLGKGRSRGRRLGARLTLKAAEIRLLKQYSNESPDTFALGAAT